MRPIDAWLVKACGPAPCRVGVLPVMGSRKLGGALPRAIASAVTMIVLSGTAAAGPADTRTRISDAKRRLAALQAQISTEQTRVFSLTASLRTMAGEVARGRRNYQAIQDRLVRTQMRRLQAEVWYQGIRNEIDRAAAEAYMRGPAYALEAVIDLESLSDVADVLTYTGSIAARNAELADEVMRTAAELQKAEQEQAILSVERRAALSSLTAQQKELTARFVDQQRRLAELARARAEMGTLLARLRARLRAEEIAAAERALANGTPLTFGQWADAFLKELHAPVARNNLVTIVAWQVAEYTEARWNPLATTYPMPGSTTYNGSGVRNYTSLAQGLDATRLTLSHCCYGYEAILANLARNADPMTTGQAIHDSRWCAGCADGGYVIDLIPTVEQYYDEYAGKSA